MNNDEFIKLTIQIGIKNNSTMGAIVVENNNL